MAAQPLRAGVELLTYRKDIDGLRAVAVLPVVLYHAGFAFTSGGYVGVDVFFVISGYLITGIIAAELRNDNFSLLSFYERRARRILPALVFVLLCSFVAGAVLLLPDQFNEFAKSALATATFLANIWFWDQPGGYFSEETEFWPLLHMWSLAVEEQFYVFYPLLLMAVFRFGRQVLLGGLVLGLLVSFAISVYYLDSQADAAFYLTPARAWELGLGAAVALFTIPSPQRQWIREAIAAVALLAIIIPVVTYDLETMFPGPAALPPCLGAAALIWIGASGPTRVSQLLSWRPMVLCGLISYSLYLWHWPIFAFYRVRQYSVELSFVEATLLIAASVIMAIVSWRYVEKPFRNRAVLTRPRVFAASGAALAAVLIGSAGILVGNGLPGRLPQEALAMVNAAKTRVPQFEGCIWTDPAADICHLGDLDADRSDFLFWGDSHAEALLVSMDQAGQQTGLRGEFVGQPGCPPLQGVDSNRFPTCRAYNDAVLDLLERREGEFGTVVLAARWALYEKGTRTKMESPEPRIELSDDIHAWTGPKTNPVVFERGLLDLIDTLRERGHKVVVLGSVPAVGWDVPMRMFVNMRWGDALPPVPTPEDVAKRHAGVERVFAKIEGMDGVRLIRLSDVLCASECKVELDGQPIYLDDDHLADPTSVKVFGPYLAKEIFGLKSSSAQARKAVEVKPAEAL